jgi:hypothetical protein
LVISPWRRFLKIIDIKKIEPAYQKRNYKLTAPPWQKRSKVSYCKCSKYGQMTCTPDPIKKGEAVFKVRISTMMTTDNQTGKRIVWYTNTRWRAQCFITWFHSTYEVWLMNNPKPDEKTPEVHKVSKPRESLGARLGLDDKQLIYRRHLQMMIRSYSNRINEYTVKNRTDPSMRRVKALARCRVGLKEAEQHKENLERIGKERRSVK